MCVGEKCSLWCRQTRLFCFCSPLYGEFLYAFHAKVSWSASCGDGFLLSVFQRSHKGLFRWTWRTAYGWCYKRFLGAVFEIYGPPVVLYVMCIFKDKLEYLAIMQAFWVISNIVYLVYRSGGGYYKVQTPVCWACGLSGAFVGTLLGAKCYSLLDAKSFRLVVYMVMAASGVVAFFK